MTADPDTPTGPLQPDNETLLRFALGELDTQSAETVRRWIAETPNIAARHAALGAMLSSLGHLRDAEPSMQVSAAQHDRLVSLLARRPQTWFSELAARAGELVAVLLHDSARAAAPTGFRSDYLIPRTLRFACGEGTIDLRLEARPHSHDWLLTGVITSPDACELVRAAHCDDDADVNSAPVEPDGYFELVLPPGRFDLRFERAGPRVAVVESLTLEPPGA
jgi:anti-sigma factor RsiW